MIVLLDTSHDLKVCEAEIGLPVAQLLTPLTRFLPQYPDEPFAIDNGAFARFNPKGFRSLLKREEKRKHLCRFVAVPDIPMNARRTLELFKHWFDELEGWPLALVAQNGIEDLDIPWELIKTIFVGGDDRWKDGNDAKDIIKTAQALGKSTHVGRVNGIPRFLKFEQLGVDSIDGSGVGRYSHMRVAIRSAREAKERQGSLIAKEVELVA